MKILHNKKDNKKALLIANTDNDYEVLFELFHQHILFGLWKLLTVSSLNEKDPEVVALKVKFGNDLKGIAYLEIVEGFVPKPMIDPLDAEIEKTIPLR